MVKNHKISYHVSTEETISQRKSDMSSYIHEENHKLATTSNINMKT
jgi:hypothetical protein